VLEEHHPVAPLPFSARTVNYTQNANPMTDCSLYCTVFMLATVAVVTVTPELENMTTINLTLNEKHVLTAARVVCTIAGQLGMPSCQPCGVIPVSSNQPQKVKTVALKWVITRGQNPER